MARGLVGVVHEDDIEDPIALIASLKLTWRSDGTSRKRSPRGRWERTLNMFNATRSRGMSHLWRAYSTMHRTQNMHQIVFSLICFAIPGAMLKRKERCD